MLKKFNIFDVLWLILFVYSFVPYNYAGVLWQRVYGVHISYLPFFFLFFVVFLKSLSITLLSGYLLLPRLIIILVIFMFIYLPIQFLILFNSGTLVSASNYFLDYAMFGFYEFIVFYGTVLYFYNRRNQILVHIKIILGRMLTVFFVIAMLAPIRYFLVDSNALFFNIFNPLGYRLFEVLFLILCSIIALGRYYGTRKKKYILFFAAYGCNLLLAGSRTGYVVYIFVLLYLLIRENLKLLFKLSFVFTIVIWILVIYIGGYEVTHRLYRLKELPMYASLNINKAIDLDKNVRRITMLLSSIEIFKKSPLIGIGLGKDNLVANFPSLYRPYIHTIARPHNFYLYLLVSTGVIGFFFIFLFLYYILKKGYLKIKFCVDNVEMYELIKHLFLANIAILILQMGYEFETEPFLWFFWAISYTAFSEKVSFISRT